MVEERYVIPICKKHDRFQTGGGRWIEISDNLTKHIEFTKSYDAILTEGECDKCIIDPRQISIDFEPINLNFRYECD